MYILCSLMSPHAHARYPPLHRAPEVCLTHTIQAEAVSICATYQKKKEEKNGIKLY